MYEIISKDEKLLTIYKKIDNQENKLAYHGLSHITNVVKTVEKIMHQLNYSQELIDAAKTAAFMHDLGCLYGKHNHAQKSYEITKKYFEKNKINSKYKHDILMAIKYHSNYRCLKNSIAPILRFADKIDITKERVAEAGYNIQGMKEYQHIETIEIIIKDDLTLNFTINKKANMKELEQYYFTKKMVHAVKNFAKYINKEYQILLNNKPWQNVQGLI